MAGPAGAVPRPEGSLSQLRGPVSSQGHALVSHRGSVHHEQGALLRLAPAKIGPGFYW